MSDPSKTLRYEPPLRPAERLLLAIAQRDGGWKCAYCSVPLVPVGDSPARVDAPGFWWNHDCPTRGHTEQPCWHGPSVRAAPGYEFPVSDHVIPKSRGGSHDIDNRVLACNWCNCSKGARLLSELPPNWWERKTYSPYWVAGEVLPA